MFDSDMQIRGKHATYWKSLCITPGNANDSNSNFKIFDNYIFAYMTATVIGLLHNRRGAIDPSDDSKDTAGMMAEIQIKHQAKLKYLYRLVMLMDESQGWTPEEKVDRAFREDTCEEAVSQGMKLFTSYFLGGLEILYDTFVAKCITDDDYVQRLYEYVQELQQEHDIDKLSTDIEELLRS